MTAWTTYRLWPCDDGRMLLRPMAESDLDDLLGVQEEGAVLALGAVFPQEDHPFPRDSIRARWAVEIEDPTIHAWVAVESERLAGFAATRDDELLHFGTAVWSWGSGLASELHDAVLYGVRAGWPSARLHVFEENHRARRFYAKHSWDATGSSTRTAYPPHPLMLEYRLDIT